MFLKRMMLTMLLATMSIVAHAGEGERLLEKFLSATSSMSASFKQTLMSDDGTVMQESAGEFYLQRPGKFRWDYTSPYEQQIISDGEKVYVYDVDLEQVTVQQQGAVLSNTPMALIEGRLKLAETFDVKQLDSKAGVYRLQLISKGGDSDFNGIVIGVDEQGLKFMQLKDQFNQSTDIVFSDLKSNPELGAGLFEFTPPKGVDVFSGG